MHLKRNAGAVVYLTVMKWRNNMPIASTGSNVLAEEFISSEERFFDFPVPNVLFSGENVLAVEIHRADVDGDDLSFDLSFTATRLGSGLLANDVDPDGDALTARLATPPFHGLVELRADGSFTYIPSPNYSGFDNFWYVASDGQLDSAATEVILNISNAPDTPVGHVDRYSVGVSFSVDAMHGVLANDEDPKGVGLVAQLVAAPLHGTLMLEPDGSFTYTGRAHFLYGDTFTYRASDGAYLSEPVTVTLTSDTARIVSRRLFYRFVFRWRRRLGQCVG